MSPRRFIALLAVFVVGATGSLWSAPWPEGQAVTYSDFSFVRAITASQNTIYFATTQGIVRYNELDRRWQEPLTGTFGVDHEDIRQIWVDEFDEQLYVRTLNGLFEYDFRLDAWFSATTLPEFNKISSHIKHPSVMHAPSGYNYSGNGELIDPWGRYWPLSDVLDDGHGMWWFGFWGYGMAKARSTNRIMELLPFGLLQERVNALHMRDGELWMGGAVFDERRTGITAFDPDKMSFRYIESGVRPDFPAIDVNCIDSDDEYLYIGTPWGLYIMNKTSKYVERTIAQRYGLYDENVISLEVVNDTVYIGTSQGLSILTGASDTVAFVHPTQFSGERIWDIEEVDGYIWIGASGGAFRLTPATGRLQRFQDDESVLFSEVYDIERWEDYLWFVSSTGLVKLDIETAAMESYHDVVTRVMPRALAVNDTIAAVASDKGMTILFHGNRKPFTKDFTSDDGLASNYVFSLIMDGDFLWIGTDRGLTRFLWNNPDRID